MTDADRLLEVLADGEPHHHLELYGLRMIVHSRVADLRKRGHTIHSWRESHANGPRYYYRLLLSPLAAASSPSPAISPTAQADEAEACHAGPGRELAAASGDQLSWLVETPDGFAIRDRL